MIVKINGEAPFQVLASNFTISPAESSYVLQVSADGKEYSDLFAVAANITRMVTGVASGSFYRLKNNTGDVSVNWRKCSGGEGGGQGGEVTKEAIVNALGYVPDRESFVITIDEETGDYVATGFNAAYEAAGGNLTVLLNVGERVMAAKEIRVGEMGGYEVDFTAYGDFDSTGNEQAIMTYFINEDDQVSEQPMRRMTITEAFDDLDRYATRIVPITQSQYDAMPESKIQPDTLYIIID